MSGNPGRKRILDRMRSALSAPSHSPTPAPNREAGLYALGILDPIDDSLARFRVECEANRTELHLVTAENEAAALQNLLSQAWLTLKAGGNSGLTEKPLYAYVQDAPELRGLAQGCEMPIRWSSAGPPQGVDFAGVTLAEALIARTGSVLVSAGTGGRAASVLPPLHIVYAPISQLVSDLSDAFERVQSSDRVRDVSMLSLITGPSRTSDIEKMLVMGAHGPRRVAILLRV